MAQQKRIAAALSLDGLGDDARLAFDVAAGAGYGGVAIPTNHPQLRPEDLGGTAIRALRKALADRGLAAAAIRVAGPRGGLADPATIDRAVDRARAGIRMAFDLGVRTVGVHAGALEAMKVSPDTLRQAAALLAEEADKAGVQLAFSADSSEKLAGLLRDVGYHRAGANLDTARLIAAGDDPLTVAEKLAGGIAQWTVADAIRAGAAARAVELGQGQAPLRELRDLLREMGFVGPAVVDVRDLADGAAGRAAELLREIM